MPQLFVDSQHSLSGVWFTAFHGEYRGGVLIGQAVPSAGVDLQRVCAALFVVKHFNLHRGARRIGLSVCSLSIWV